MWAGIATCYGLDRRGIESRWGAIFTVPVQTGPVANPASYTMGTGSLPGVKRPALDVDHPLPFIADIKERVKLYLFYSPSGTSLSVLEWILALDNDLFHERFQSITCMGSLFYLAHPLGHFLSAALSYRTWLGIQSPEPDLSQILMFCNREVNRSSVPPVSTMLNTDLTGSVWANSSEIPDQPASNTKHVYRCSSVFSQ